MLQGRANVLAVLVSATQTVTSYITLTMTGETAQYQTFTQVSTVETVTGTTYITTGKVTGPVTVLTTARFPVTVITETGGSSCIGSPPQCVGWAQVITATHYVRRTGYVMTYSTSSLHGKVTSQYATSVLTTWFSTSASTSTYATSQVVGVTATQTLVSEQAGPSISDMLSQNLWVILVLVVVALAVLAFRLGGRRGTGPSVSPPPTQTVQGPTAGTVYCLNCGTPNPAANEFCGKCGTKLS